ncbi:MAG: OmpA family protein [Saprospiraceae bacterium]|nr:OmpA family protein [Saprospiraceae bacterium]
MSADLQQLSVGIAFLLLCSCVSTGKYRSLEAENGQLEADLLDKASVAEENSRLSLKVEDQRDEQIKQNTLIGQLLTEKSTLEERVASLTHQLSLQSNEAESVQATLNAELQKRNEELAKKEALLSTIVESYELNQTKALTIVSRLSELLADFDENQLEVEYTDLEARVLVYASFLFSATLQLQQTGRQALETIATVIKDYPESSVQIEGHTDNTTVNPTRQYSDAMDLSALRASSVMRFMIREAGLNANQVLATGKAGFYPRVSNETPAGKALNNRIEIRIRIGQRELIELIKKGQ